MIDHGRFDEAIDYFSHLNAMAPQDDRVRVAFASAYVARSGLHVADFINFAESFQQRSVDQSATSKALLAAAIAVMKQRPDAPMDLTSYEPLIAQFLDQLAAFQDALTRIAAFPSVAPEREVDIAKAIEILTPIQPGNRGAHLYTGVLRLIQVKTQIVHRQFQPIMKLETKERCVVNLEVYEKLTARVLVISAQALEDFTQAFPSRAPKLQESKKSILAMANPLALNNSQEMKSSPWVSAAFESLLNSSPAWKCEP